MYGLRPTSTDNRCWRRRTATELPRGPYSCAVADGVWLVLRRAAPAATACRPTTKRRNTLRSTVGRSGSP
eukprot:3133008-Pyramimonas_sp.AAC.1